MENEHSGATPSMGLNVMRGIGNHAKHEASFVKDELLENALRLRTTALAFLMAGVLTSGAFVSWFVGSMMKNEDQAHVTYMVAGCLGAGAAAAVAIGLRNRPSLAGPTKRMANSVLNGARHDAT